MKNIFNFFGLILFIMSPKVHSISDCYFIVNTSLIDSIKSVVENKFRKEDDYDCGSKSRVFVLNNSNSNEGFILIPIFDNKTTHFLKEAYLKVDIKNYKRKILEIISKPNGSSIKLDPNIEVKFLESKKVQKFMPLLYLSYMKNDLGLKKYIDFEKDGHVYYTVPSEDKLDDIHMVYESKDGKERKEFVFTKSGIIPIEDTISWQIQNGWNKFRNFIGLSNNNDKKVKNKNHQFDDERINLKDKLD